MRAIPVLVMPPARPVVSLEDAKAHLRIAEDLGPELGPVLGRVISACGFLADLSDLASEAPAPGKPEGAEAANGSAGTGAASVSGKACPPRAGSIC
ncbi:hypothetical protein BYZ73_13700 [Rhodovulum viride]|uniref:Uncharacterized protein n=1 Tax=Rhodovulum viride TaxID=1231134 RepID=A0ABX9DG17_9RHOB|nr:hypothetical protein [Rhodovulum viride]RAP40639.1 hypothetical protein BYZ73_13700 [Rhodovulum viride]